LTIHDLQLVNREALAQTVMLDQTSHDAQRKPLTNDEARKLWNHIEGVTVSEAVTLLSVVRATEAFHGIKE
jgi:hypothetical protein